MGGGAGRQEQRGAIESANPKTKPHRARQVYAVGFVECIRKGLPIIG